MEPMQSAVLAPLPTSRSSPRPQVARPVPAISVVVVNYRRWKRTARLVAQLQHSRALASGIGEIVIVDNHSPAHPLLPGLRRAEGVSLRRWGRNRGFAR